MLIKELQELTKQGETIRQAQREHEIPKIVENCIEICRKAANIGKFVAHSFNVPKDYLLSTVAALRQKGLSAGLDRYNGKYVIEMSWAIEKKLFLMRGWPGSGKSYKANELRLEHDAVVFSADKFMVDVMGRYEFKVERLTECHAKCQMAVHDAMINDKANIVVDNTNIRRSEMLMYEHFARLYGYAVEYVEGAAPWRLDAQACFEKNLHGVPKDKIERMMKDYEQ